MAACIAPAATEKIRRVLGTTDNAAKIAFFGAILAGRFVIPQVTDKAAIESAFWNRVEQATQARLALLSAFVVPDLFDCCNSQMFCGTKTWKENARDRSRFVTDTTTAIMFFIAMGGHKVAAVKDGLARASTALKVGSMGAPILKVCLLSWTLASAFDLSIARNDANSTSIHRWSRVFHLTFAVASLIWRGRATPIAIAGLASGIAGTANHFSTSFEG